MDEKELRIGNYVDLYGGIAQIQRSDFSSTEHGIAIDSGKPIPLTEERLIKLGFKLEDDLGDMIYYKKDKYIVCIDHDNLAFYRQTANDGLICLLWGHKHFIYVHQLQNLYFALTGEELRFNG